MMHELKVNLDEKLLQRVHRLAKEHGRSFEQEVEAILLKAAPEEEPEFDRLSDALRISAMRKPCACFKAASVDCY
jgi:plasmid stability protein